MPSLVLALPLVDPDGSSVRSKRFARSGGTGEPRKYLDELV